MGFALSIPVVGFPDATEEPKVGNDLQTIASWGNGHILGTDLDPNAGIQARQLAPGAGRLGMVVASSAMTATDGQLVVINGTAPYTITLPSPNVNALVGVQVTSSAVSGAAPFTVRTPSGYIYGPGLGNSSTSFPLGAQGALAVLQGSGAAWMIVAGMQDTGWIPLNLSVGVPSLTYISGKFTPAVRVTGDRAALSGGIHNGGGDIAPLSGMAGIPANCIPAAHVDGNGVYLNAWSAYPVRVSSTGYLINGTGFPAGGDLAIDGISYQRI